MAQTPFHDLGSTDILAAHISGLQHAINKIEQVLNMRTASITGHQLVPVTDQDDPNLRYRIYEGTIRNWLEDPEPVIKRDGQVVSPSEYTVYPAYGVVVFNQQQPPNAQITADFSYVAGQSEVVNWLLLNAAYAFQRVGLWRTNNVGAAASSALSTAADALDVYPFPVPYTMSFDRIGVNVATAGAAGAKARLGIYADNGQVYPGALVLDAGEVALDSTGAKSITINVTLQPGLYWLARIQNSVGTMPQIYGMDSAAVLSLGIDDSLSGRPATGFRASVAYGPLPDPFPEGASLRFGTQPSVWLRRSL